MMQIQASDVRLMNYVLKDGEVSRVLNPYDTFYPIPLTEEWLVRFGFVKKSDVSGYYFIKNKHRVYLFPEGKFEFEFNYSCNERVNLFRTFQSVHQLQNLTHSLTGQELELL